MFRFASPSSISIDDRQVVSASSNVSESAAMLSLQRMLYHRHFHCDRISIDKQLTVLGK